MEFVSLRLLLHSPFTAQLAFLPLDPWENSFLLNTAGQVLPWGGSSSQESVHFVLKSPPGGAFILTSSEERAAEFPGFFNCFEELEHIVREYSVETFPQLSGIRFPPPPYYVATLKAGVDYTLGGISVTPAGEVKKEGTVVRGLYAAGEIVGGLHGGALLPGMPLSETIFLSRVAGSSAAAYAQR